MYDRVARARGALYAMWLQDLDNAFEEAAELSESAGTALSPCFPDRRKCVRDRAQSKLRELETQQSRHAEMACFA